MSYKTILTHCNDMRRIGPLLATAVTLAERFQAHLLALSVAPPWRSLRLDQVCRRWLLTRIANSTAARARP